MCDPIWQVALGSSVMGFPLRALHETVNLGHAE